VLPLTIPEVVFESHPLANGDIVVAGMVGFTGRISSLRLALAELKADGRLDPSFGDGGVELTNVRLVPWQILALPDGKLLVLGPSRQPGLQEPRVTSFPDWELLRLLPDGQPDTSFGRDGLLRLTGLPVPGEGAIREAAPQLEPDGGVLLPTLIGPPFEPSTVDGLVRLNPDGSLDTSFAQGGTLALAGYIVALSVGQDGSIVAAGVDGGGHRWLQRLTPDGAPDTSFNGGSQVLPPLSIGSMLVEGDGAILLQGFPQANELVDNQVLRYTASGTPDPSWGVAGVLDLGPNFGYINQLLPSSGGGTLLVTIGVPAQPFPMGGPQRVRVLRMTANGQIAPTLGGAGGLQVTLPLGGVTYPRGTIAKLDENSFTATGVMQRADGTLLFNGRVEAAEVELSDAGAEFIRWVSGFALAALGDSYQLDPTFNGVQPPRLSARVLSRCLRASGVEVTLTSSDAAVAVVTVRGRGQTIAHGTVPFFGKGQAVGRRTVRVPLTAAGRRQLHRGRLHITVTVHAADLAGNHTSAHASATLRA